MANTKANKKKIRRFSLRKFSNLKQWQKMVIFAVVFGLVASAILYKSFAATTTTDYIKGYMDWHGSGTAQYTPHVKSSDGWLKVATNFDSYNLLFDGSYIWYVQEYYQGGWTTVRTSTRKNADGGLDSECYADKIYSGRIYRIKFVPTSGYYMHGNFWVRGNSSTC